MKSTGVDRRRKQSMAIDGNRTFSATEKSVAERYGFRVTPYYHALGLLHEGVRRQYWPDARELEDNTLGADPFDEAKREHEAGVKGLVQRFEDRILLRVTSQCAVACRHCTRKGPLSAGTCGVLEDIPAALDHIRARPKIREILLSGGDALMLKDDEIHNLVATFAALPQIDAIRVGTRLPVVMPSRVTQKLARQLGQTKKVWVNTQFNHPAEITPESSIACGRLVDAGIPVSSQGVLLRGVNDDAETLCALFSGLQRIRVRPYYMFVCDRVAGTSHFHVDAQRARELEREVSERLGGLAVPRFVADCPGAKCKTPVGEL